MQIIYLDNPRRSDESESDYAERIAVEGRDVRLCVVTPAVEFLEEWGIEAIAAKDVPAGRPFKIVSDEFLVAYASTPRNDWTINPAMLTDGVGGTEI